MWNSENSEPLFDLYSSVVYSEQPKETFKHMNMGDKDRISPYNIEYSIKQGISNEKKENI